MKIVSTESVVRYNVHITEVERAKLEAIVINDLTESDMFEDEYNEFRLTWDAVLRFAKIFEWSDSDIDKLKSEMMNAPSAGS